MATVAAISASVDEVPVDLAWVEDFAAVLHQADPGAYINFLGDEGAARIRAAYPRGTWDRLAAAKQRYDPDNLFRLNQNVPPARKAA
jgi:FAD/FMN-containing dehydrogenase